MKKIIKTLILILLFKSTINYGQTKPIGEEPLSLDEFNFDTKITLLYPDKYLEKNSNDTYTVNEDKNDWVTFRKDSTFIDNYSDNERAIGIEYHQTSWTNINQLALFVNQSFQKINTATTLNGKIKVINPVATDISKEQSEDILRALVNKYGKYEKLKNKWNEKYDMYQWIYKDRIIRYVIQYDDEKNTIKMTVDQDKNTIEKGKKEHHYIGYIFIINRVLKDEVLGKMRTGDFVYLDNKNKL